MLPMNALEASPVAEDLFNYNYNMSMDGELWTSNNSTLFEELPSGAQPASQTHNASGANSQEFNQADLFLHASPPPQQEQDQVLSNPTSYDSASQSILSSSPNAPFLFSNQAQARFPSQSPPIQPQYQQTQQHMHQQQQHQQQQQQQQPHQQQPLRQYSSHVNESQPVQQPTHYPPPHLFANVNSAFNNATFDVENDINGLNPISQPNILRNSTGNSLINSYQGNYQGDQEDMQNHPSRKRARNDSDPSANNAMLLTNNNNLGVSFNQQGYSSEPRTLDASTFHLTNNGNYLQTGNGLPPSYSTALPIASQQEYHRTPSQQSLASSPQGDDEDVYDMGDGYGQFRGKRGESAVSLKMQKHQLTDRQRRAKIKESMDQLKQLVPIEANQKADQASVIAGSVTLVKNLKDEVANLRRMLKEMEISKQDEINKLELKRMALSRVVPPSDQSPHLSSSPFTSMMASLNGAGVSMWRIGLTGKILEVNLVFELVSGFRAQDVCGNTPCGAPLFGSLSIMPAAFLEAFSQSSSLVPTTNDDGQPLEHPVNSSNNNNRGSKSPLSSNSSRAASTPNSDPALKTESPNSPGSGSVSSSSASSSSGSSSSGSSGSTPMVKTERSDSSNSTTMPAITVNPASTSHGSGSQASVAPLYANASISHFPVVPQSSLQNFFPYKCRSLIDAQTPGTGIMQPQPHGSFLVQHLAALPYNHVLKLLMRHHTLWGEILESIVTLCLVRDAQGQPDYIMLLSTPDCRRLLTPATHTQSVHMGTPPKPNPHAPLHQQPPMQQPIDLDGIQQTKTLEQRAMEEIVVE